MVGDVQQLQAIEAGAAFRLLAERHGVAEIGEVRRQTAQWMRDATRAFATGRIDEALGAYAFRMYLILFQFAAFESNSPDEP